MADEVTMAREALLDAIEALVAQLDAIIVVGAQAIYLHTGSAEVAVAEFTTDGDLALDPDVLSSDPLVNEAMRQAGFEPDPRSSAIGTWISRRGVPVDLMVPDAVAGVGRRGVRVPPHDSKAMRRARGLEAALVDNSPMVIGALVPATRSTTAELGARGPTVLNMKTSVRSLRGSLALTRPTVSSNVCSDPSIVIAFASRSGTSLSSFKQTRLFCS